MDMKQPIEKVITDKVAIAIDDSYEKLLAEKATLRYNGLSLWEGHKANKTKVIRTFTYNDKKYSITVVHEGT